MGSNKLARMLLSSEDVSYHVEAVALQIPGKCGASLKALRLNAGYTQAQVASAFHRTGTCVTGWEKEVSWPPKDLTLRVLQFLNIPEDVIRNHVVIEKSLDLDPRLYMTGNTLEIEFNFFLRTRGNVLQAVTNRALEGSDNAAKLYFELMEKTDKAHSALENSPRKVNQIASTWTQGMLTETRHKRSQGSPEPEVIPSEIPSQVPDNT